MEQGKAKRRLEYLDIAKGILILLVIKGHLGISFLPEFLHEDSFYRVFHVSAFLVMGGYFLKDELLDSPINTFKKKFHSLFLKALWFFLVAVLLHNEFLDWNLYPSGTSNEAFLYFDSSKDWIEAIAKVLMGMSFEPMVQPTWFALTLFFAIVFISALQWLLKKINWYSELNMVVIMISLCVISCLLYPFSPENYVCNFVYGFSLSWAYILEVCKEPFLINNTILFVPAHQYRYNLYDRSKTRFYGFNL